MDSAGHPPRRARATPRVAATPVPGGAAPPAHLNRGAAARRSRAESAARRGAARPSPERGRAGRHAGHARGTLPWRVARSPPASSADWRRAAGPGGTSGRAPRRPGRGVRPTATRRSPRLAGGPPPTRPATRARGGRPSRTGGRRGGVWPEPSRRPAVAPGARRFPSPCRAACAPAEAPPRAAPPPPRPRAASEAVGTLLAGSRPGFSGRGRP